MAFLTVLTVVFQGTAKADGLSIDVDRVPGHGIVVADVDLTAALHLQGVTSVRPESVRVRERQTGAEVPAQFAPSAGFDSRRHVSGTLVVRLPPHRAARLQLDFDAPEPVATTVVDPPSCVVTAAMCRVHHAAGIMGGLPHRIEFSETGKVVERFRWRDRVHHKKHGGWFLDEDPEARIERVSEGPLATVVEVRARYGKPDLATVERPEAVYRWCYLKHVPLLRVTATATQRGGEAWQRAHFLELKLPGGEFGSWAGGEPVTRGIFENTGMTFRHQAWGALVGGRDAIALLDCGQALIGDRDGSSYLSAYDGSRAWPTTPNAERKWSSWMWIGTAADPVKDIRSMAAAPPSAARVTVRMPELESAIAGAGGERRRSAAGQLAGGGRFELALDAATGNWPPALHAVEADQLGLIVEDTGTGIGLLSLHDLQGREFVPARNAPLFQVSLCNQGPKRRTLQAVADKGWREVRVTPAGAAGLRMRWAEPSSRQLKGLTVTATVTADSAVDALVWDFQVTPPTTGWALWNVRFNLCVREPDDGGTVFVPRSAGQLERGAWGRQWRYAGRYPSGWITMPYMAAYESESGGAGVYVGAHDPGGSVKEIFAASQPGSRTVGFSIEYPVPDMGKPGVSFELPGTIVWRRFDGDWFDAACIYRDWVRREARWYPKLGPDGREDTPKWMRELSVWARGGGPPTPGRPLVQAFREKMGVPVGFHWYRWHQIPFDNDYPHYFPPDDSFDETVKILQAKQIHVMPYTNARLWDTRDRGTQDFQFSNVARPGATKDEQGELYIEKHEKESDGTPVRHAVMCPSSAVWRNKVQETVLRLMNEYGVHGVYLDQVGAAKPLLCFDETHGHPLGGGHWWAESYGKILGGIREKMPEGRILTTESNAETYVKGFDGYLTYNWQYDGQVPAFAAVYGGALQMFGRAYRRGPTKDLALRMKAGQQLVYGEQIGWIDPRVVNEPDNFAFLRQLVHLRSRFTRYFYAGQMGRPPSLEGDIPNVTADWNFQGVWNVTTPAAMAGGWELPDENRAVLLFVNVGDKAIETAVAIDAAAYGVAGERVRVTAFTSDGETDAHLVPGRFRRVIALPPRTAVAWEICPEKRHPTGDETSTKGSRHQNP